MKAFDYMRNILFILAIAVLVAAAGCLIFKIKPATVMSGSMEPAFRVGSLVLIQKDAEIKEGDAIAFHVGSNFVTHRVVRRDEDGYITKGDANKTEDPWKVSESSIYGKVIGSVPYIGYVLHAISSKRGIIITVTIVLCILLSSMLVTEKKEKGKSAASVA